MGVYVVYLWSAPNRTRALPSDPSHVECETWTHFVDGRAVRQLNIQWHRLYCDIGYETSEGSVEGSVFDGAYEPENMPELVHVSQEEFDSRWDDVIGALGWDVDPAARWREGAD